MRARKFYKPLVHRTPIFAALLVSTLGFIVLLEYGSRTLPSNASNALINHVHNELQGRQLTALAARATSSLSSPSVTPATAPSASMKAASSAYINMSDRQSALTPASSSEVVGAAAAPSELYLNPTIQPNLVSGPKTSSPPSAPSSSSYLNPSVKFNPHKGGQALSSSSSPYLNPNVNPGTPETSSSVAFSPPTSAYLNPSINSGKFNAPAQAASPIASKCQSRH